MIAREVTESQMYQAIRKTSAKYGDNVIFKTFEPQGRGFSFTLTVKKAAEHGGRRSNTGRRIAAACWHVHRYFLREVFKLSPSALIKTSVIEYNGQEDFEKNHDKTGDINRGSQALPMPYRNACACNGGVFRKPLAVTFV